MAEIDLVGLRRRITAAANNHTNVRATLSECLRLIESMYEQMKPEKPEEPSIPEEPQPKAHDNSGAVEDTVPNGSEAD